MKEKHTIFSGLCFALIYTILILASCSSPDQAEVRSNLNDQCSMNFSQEDTLNLNNHVKDTAAGQQEILNFPQRIKTALNPALPLLIDSIYAEAFCALKDSADRYHDADSGCVSYFTGLKMSYGLNADFSAVTILYQPVYMCKIAAQNKYTVKSTGVYFQYDHSSNAFDITTDTSSFKRYADSILISPSGSDPFRHFRNPPADNDTLGDVRSVIFPFQEIAAVIADNQSPYIKIWNAIRQVQLISTGETLNKHDLLLGPVQLHIPLSPVTTGCGSALFCNKFANLGSMCPPGCDSTY